MCGIALDRRLDDRRAVDAGQPQVGDDDVEGEVGELARAPPRPTRPARPGSRGRPAARRPPARSGASSSTSSRCFMRVRHLARRQDFDTARRGVHPRKFTSAVKSRWSDLPSPSRLASFSHNPMLRQELLEQLSRIAVQRHRPRAVGRRAGAVSARASPTRSPDSTCSTKRCFARVPELRLVSKYGVGLDMIDLDAARRHGVSVRWTPGVNRQSVAELDDLLHDRALPQPRSARRRSAPRRLGDHPRRRGRFRRRRSASSAAATSARRSRASAARSARRVLAHDIRRLRRFLSRHGVEPVHARRAARASRDIVDAARCRSMRRRAG